jgi:hypothetical protein
MVPHLMPAGRGPAVLDLLELDSLPCGCVAAAYRARMFGLTVISVEAKGPHCTHVNHVQGRFLEVGAMSDLAAEDPEE